MHGASKFESKGIPEGHFLPIMSLRHRGQGIGCYPERNFARNQLLGGSMSLSPLYTVQKNDLHVNKPTGLHQPFDWLRPDHVKIATFRVYA